MKLVIALLFVTSVAYADKQEPPHHAVARTWLRTLLETRTLPPASTAKPVFYYVEHVAGACNQAGGKVATAAAMKTLKACAIAAKAKHGDKVDEVAFDDIKLDKFLKRFSIEDPPVKQAAKGAKAVTVTFSDDESLTFVLAVKDSDVKAVWFLTHE